jgi:DNA/RNA endonuclease YhcR with UshA esterase domain
VAVALMLVVGVARGAAISDRDAQTHVGQSVIVEGIVTGTHVTRTGTAFLDFGPHYPDQDFTVVIFARSAAGLGDIARYYGKRVDVSGTVELYHNRPEIIVRSPEQIRAVP